MAIPKDILAVARPKNTFVVAYGKDKDRYAVRKYVGCRYDKGRHIPIKGPTIGHIVGGRFVESDDIAAVSGAKCRAELKEWASAQLCEKVFASVIPDLERHYSRKDALRIYSLAVLRVCNPGMKDYEAKERYETSFLSEFHQGVSLSKNKVSDFMSGLGKAYPRIVAFMRDRAKKVKASDHVLVDGTLKTDTSTVNTLSDFSRKARVKGCRDISVLYAYNLAEREPICSKCYPGNMLDLTAVDDFLAENRITEGLLVMDKGFPSSATEKHRAANPKLHFLNPVKRNSKYVETHHLLDFDGVLKDREGVTYRKAKVNGQEKWLYAYRDARRAAAEEAAYLANAKKEGKYSHDEHAGKRKFFGVIVLESDVDLTFEDAYRAYEERWEIELVMRFYKSACEFDDTRVHSDYSVLGSEFCDFLASLLTFKLIKAFDKAGVLKDMTYSRAMALLRRAKKIKLDGEWRLIKINPAVERLLGTLDLLPRADKLPLRGVGRPRKAIV